MKGGRIIAKLSWQGSCKNCSTASQKIRCGQDGDLLKKKAQTKLLKVWSRTKICQY